jgi:hypothetical protein
VAAGSFAPRAAASVSASSYLPCAIAVAAVRAKSPPAADCCGRRTAEPEVLMATSNTRTTRICLVELEKRACIRFPPDYIHGVGLA